MKVPFSIKYRPQIESGEYKVETRDGRVVHNIWRVKEPSYTNNRKMEVCALIDGEEDVLVFFEGGRYLPTTQDTDSPFDLFIITPEEEMSEFEMAIHRRLNLMNGENLSATELLEETKGMAAELLDLARKELEPEVLERLEVAYKNQDEVVYENGKRDGKAEALKGLPRWKKLTAGEMADVAIIAHCIVKGDYFLTEKDLEKLPGFKED